MNGWKKKIVIFTICMDLSSLHWDSSQLLVVNFFEVSYKNTQIKEN